MSNQVEFGFLQASREALRGKHRGRRAVPLDARHQGLTRDQSGAVPVRQVLEDALPKACLEFLAEAGGVFPRRFVVAGRRREGSLFAESVWSGVGPLHFTIASFDLLEALHDVPPEWLAKRLPSPKTLGDRLVFHLVLGPLLPGLPPEVARRSALSRLVDGSLEGPDELDPLLSRPDHVLALRAIEDGLVSGWIERARAGLGLRTSERVAWLDRFAASLSAHAVATCAAGVHSLATCLVRFYRAFLRDLRTPPQVLAEAAEVAREFRKVSEQEAWLRTLGGLFAPAVMLEEEMARIGGLPFVEREEEEKLLFDEYQLRGREALPQAGSLHTALMGRLR